MPPFRTRWTTVSSVPVLARRSIFRYQPPNVIIPDAAIRKAYRTQRDADHYGSLSPFMRAAVLAAYTDEGKAWIDELMDFCA